MNKIEKKQLKSVFWRSFALQGAFNYERMQNVGYMYAMLPVIKKLYRNKEDQAAAITRHLEIFNTTPAVVPTIMGISAAMEEENANNPAFDVQSINAVKASLMGPLAGIGDSIFWGTVRIIAAGIGVSIAKDGNIFGPLLFLVLYNLPNILVRIFGLKLGYQVGVNSLDRIQKEGLMDKIMAVATIVGLCVVGGMVATMLNITTPLKWNISGAEIVVQDILDQILPKMLPLVFTFGIYKLLKKASITKITIGIIIFGIAVHLIGIL
ncbi:PTS system mannose/fructose/sorbose family transporter subunit IID [Enterococcus gallinarum]|uniref:PTS system mannose/fructose/sorbose family transporter subunit IID n=1 Tax=Enterococcus gallinarum TaxID=1353 RepID=UPI001D17A5F7|nr:PTS system mannose/fructose/sorbose family transporter subunit IID [Enterococcus gallinarum]MCC4044605.1 PTS system mannose/fructose/sorbose family transporter subunit IID [Enterococcus gallinarum]